MPVLFYPLPVVIRYVSGHSDIVVCPKAFVKQMLEPVMMEQGRNVCSYPV